MTGSRTIYINRAPVLTLWAAVVAERLGFRRDEALTLGRAVAVYDCCKEEFVADGGVNEVWRRALEQG